MPYLPLSSLTSQTPVDEGSFFAVEVTSSLHGCALSAPSTLRVSPIPSRKTPPFDAFNTQWPTSEVRSSSVEQEVRIPSTSSRTLSFSEPPHAPPQFEPSPPRPTLPSMSTSNPSSFPPPSQHARKSTSPRYGYGQVLTSHPPRPPIYDSQPMPPNRQILSPPQRSISPRSEQTESWEDSKARKHSRESPEEDGDEVESVIDFPARPKMDETTAFKARSTCKPFITKLGFLLRNPQEYGDVIRWNPPGTSFVLIPTQRLIDVVLPEIFAHKSVDAFTRQLNTYTFEHPFSPELAKFMDDSIPHCIPTKKASAWSHHLFTRDDQDMWAQLTPRPSRARAAHGREKQALLMAGGMTGSLNSIRADMEPIESRRGKIAKISK